MTDEEFLQKYLDREISLSDIQWWDDYEFLTEEQCWEGAIPALYIVNPETGHSIKVHSAML